MPPPPPTPRPWIEKLEPNKGAAGSVSLAFTVWGGGFSATSVIVFDGNPQTTTFTNATRLDCALTLGPSVGERLVFVRDGAQSSDTMVFTVI